ncbi:MAG: ATP-binding protein, partial [Thermodesulfobacteriota bacterium]
MKRVALQVRDEGQGMTEEVKNRIFEPYFSTKGPGEGTGMGLALVHAIVTRHGGEVRVESAPGEGALFSVFLPVIDRVEQHREAPVPRPVSSGTERVMLVEDEPQVLNLGVRMLTRL